MFGHDNQDNHDNQQHYTPHHDVVQPPDQASDQPAEAPQQVAPSQSSADDSQAAAATPAANPDTDDLLDIKQEALQALTPLVGHLDQTPEEQFRTTMMMIQASDNHSLVKVAYQAAKQISDEKERAQALLDIVNEINYFTQHAAA